ncbi:hypothetical protein ACLB90_14925 [Stenotrophomonas sp. LGBM10]
MDKFVDFVTKNCKLAASLSVVSLASFFASFAAIAAVGGGMKERRAE